MEPGDSRYPGELGEPGTDDDAFYGGPSETKRLKEPCLLEVELREPPRRKIRDPPNDQNRPRYTQNHPHGINDQKTRRLNDRKTPATKTWAAEFLLRRGKEEVLRVVDQLRRYS